MSTTTTIQAIPLPEDGDAVDVVGDLSAIVSRIESRLFMRFASSGDRDSAITSPIQGMVCYLADEDRFSFYEAGGWRKGTLVRAGVAGARPSAASTPEGTIYCSTDQNDLEIQIGGSWVLLNGRAANGSSGSDQSAKTMNGTQKTIESVTIDADADSDRSVMVTAYTTLQATDDSTFQLTLEVGGTVRCAERLQANASGGFANGHVSVSLSLPKGSSGGDRLIELKCVRLTGSGTATPMSNSDATRVSYIAAPK